MEAGTTSATLRERAGRYREMVRTILDPRTIEALNSLAEEYEAMAEQLEKIEGERPQRE